MKCVAKVVREWNRGRCMRTGTHTRYGVKMCAQHAGIVDAWTEERGKKYAVGMMVFWWGLKQKEKGK